MPDGHRLPLKSARTLARTSSRAPTWEPSQRKPRTNVGKRGGCAGFRAWCFWGSFLPALVLVGSFCSSLFFFLFGRRPKDRSFPACDRGRHVPAPGWEGRRIRAGAPTEEPVFSGIPYVQWPCTAVSWFLQKPTTTITEVLLLAFIAHYHRGPASRFYRSRFRGAAEANLPGHRSPVACLHRSPSTSRLLSSRLAEGSFHCICPSRQQFRTGHQRLWTMQLAAHCTLVAQRPCVKSTSFS